MLTGRTRFRSARITGRLVLQVQVKEPDVVGFDVYWRDASTEDLAELHTLTYGLINIALRLPPMPEELPGEETPRGPTRH